MAAANPVQALQDEITCSICLDYFTDPMMITGCGHNFCNGCITKAWRQLFTNVSCPQCRKFFSKARLTSNRQLKNVVEASRELFSQNPKEPVLPELEKSLGDLHQEPLKPFSQKDGAPICARGEAHNPDHLGIPTEDAAKEQKNQIQSRLETMKKRRDYVKKFKEVAEITSQELLKRTGVERQVIATEVENFCQALKDQAQFLYLHLDKLENDILKKKEEKDSKYSQGITQLNDLISTAEKMYEQPGAEFLKGTTKLNACIDEIKKACDQLEGDYNTEFSSTTNWCGEEKFDEHTLGGLENRCDKITEQNTSLKKTLQKFREKLVTELWNVRRETLESFEVANVTLDRDTAHTLLVLSEDQRSACVDMESWEEMPYHEKRFDKRQCVLGDWAHNWWSKYYWEVDVEQGKEWGVGVAKESVERKRPLYFDPESGIWGIGLDKGYWAFTLPESTPLNLTEPLKRIQVYLDYEEGGVSFFNAETKTLIFSFPPATFGGENVFPWFYIGDGLIRMCELEVDQEELEFKLLDAGIIRPEDYFGFQ